MKLDMEPLDLSKTLAESLRVVSGRADDKNLVLDADIDDTISVVADRRAVKQIIVNLLSNAVKFTPDGGRVVVRGRQLGDCIVLTIADTGIGIAQQSLKRLGRPFEQVESQLTKTYHGSGLGLAIARSADQSAWRIDAVALEARHRHRRVRVAAARRADGQAEDRGRRLEHPIVIAEPTDRANARPMTGSAKQSTAGATV